MTSETGTDPSNDRGRIRASDGEREEYARTIREAVTEGRLNLGEGDERLAQVYGAVYRDQLPPVVADLPRQVGQPWGPPWARGRGEGGEGRGRRHEHRHDHEGWPPWGRPGEGGHRHPSWRGFGRHTVFVLIVAAILITIWAFTATSFFWPAIPLAFLAIGLIKHGFWMRWSRITRTKV